MRAFSQMVETGEEEESPLSTNKIKWHHMIYKGSNEIQIDEVLTDIGIQDIIEQECESILWNADEYSLPMMK